MVASADLVGRVIAGKYAVRSAIGSGAMGTVYRARQIALDKVVALKVLNDDLRDDPEFVLRFHTEARAASRLDHPHSTRVIDFGEEPDGLLYIAMELLEGRTLAEIIEREVPLPAPRVATIVAKRFRRSAQRTRSASFIATSSRTTSSCSTDATTRTGPSTS